MAWSELTIPSWWIQHAPLIKLGASLPASEKRIHVMLEQRASGGLLLIYVKPYAERALQKIVI